MEIPRYANGWWHWPALISAGIVLAVMALAVSVLSSADNPPPKFMTDVEVQRAADFCHDKGMLTAHYFIHGRYTHMWCLMEVPK